MGTASGDYTQTAIGVTTTYPRSLMPGPPANTVGYFDPVRPSYVLPVQPRSVLMAALCSPYPLKFAKATCEGILMHVLLNATWLYVSSARDRAWL